MSTEEPRATASAAPASAAESAAPASATEETAGSSSAPSASSALGKRPRDQWFGAAGDGGSHAASSAVAAKLQQVETTAKVSSIKSKLSKPKTSTGPGGESARKVALTKEEILANQSQHREKMEAKGKPVPYYRK